MSRFLPISFLLLSLVFAAPVAIAADVPEGCFSNADLIAQSEEFKKQEGTHVVIVDVQSQIEAFKATVKDIDGEVAKLMFAWADGEDAAQAIVFVMGPDNTCQKMVAPKSAVVRLLWKISGEPA